MNMLIAAMDTKPIDITCVINIKRIFAIICIHRWRVKEFTKQMESVRIYHCIFVLAFLQESLSVECIP